MSKKKCSEPPKKGNTTRDTIRLGRWLEVMRALVNVVLRKLPHIIFITLLTGSSKKKFKIIIPNWLNVGSFFLLLLLFLSYIICLCVTQYRGCQSAVRCCFKPCNNNSLVCYISSWLWRFFFTCRLLLINY